MTLEQIDREEAWKDDARNDPDPRDKPYFSRWTISGKMNYEAWSDIEIFLADKGIRIEKMVDA